MKRIAWVVAFLLGFLLVFGVGRAHGQIQGRGQFYWRVMADTVQVSQHLQFYAALNALLAAHKTYPVDVPLWLYCDCVADLNRRDPSLPPAPPPAELPPDTVTRPVELPDTTPPAEVPDTATSPTYSVPTPDEIGSATIVEPQPDGSVRYVMTAGGNTFVRWNASVQPGIWKVVVDASGIGGRIYFGAETFVIVGGDVQQAFYRSFAAPANFRIELDNGNEPMDRIIRRLELLPADLSEAEAVYIIPPVVEMAIGDEAQMCAVAIMPGGQPILDAVQVALPECQAALAESYSNPFAP